MKAKIKFKTTKEIIEFEKNIATSDLIKELQSCRDKKQFYEYGNFFFDPSDVTMIEVVENQMKAQRIKLVDTKVEKVYTKEQLDKQPTLRDYAKNIAG